MGKQYDYLSICYVLFLIHKLEKSTIYYRKEKKHIEKRIQID